MRALLRRAFDAPLERLFARLDQGVSEADHLVIARYALTLPLPSFEKGETLGSVGTINDVLAHRAVSALDEDVPHSMHETLVSTTIDALRERTEKHHVAFHEGDFELGVDEAPWHIACLIDDPAEPGPPLAHPCPTVPMHEGMPWAEDADAACAMRGAATQILGGRKLGWIEPDAALTLIRTLSGGAEPRAWFRKRGAVYGSANLLRGLVAASRHFPNDPLAETTRDLCDRLIRHLEVRREGYLPFWRASLPEDHCVEVERARFTLALLEAAEVFGDPRYLNSAMKAVDWQTEWIDQHCRVRPPGIEGLHVRHALLLQVRALACQERELARWARA